MLAPIWHGLLRLFSDHRVGCTGGPTGAVHNDILADGHGTLCPATRVDVVLCHTGHLPLTADPVVEQGTVKGRDHAEVSAVVPGRFPAHGVCAGGTELQGSDLLKISDALAWIDGDLVRLLEHEFVTQWDCW